jgi:hypothetical protein
MIVVARDCSVSIKKMRENREAFAHRICPIQARAPIIGSDSGEGFLLGPHSGENASCATVPGERRAENGWAPMNK